MLTISYDELGLDGKIKSVKAEIETDETPTVKYPMDSVVGIATGGEGFMLIPVHNLRYLVYEPNDET